VEAEGTTTSEEKKVEGGARGMGRERERERGEMERGEREKEREREKNRRVLCRVSRGRRRIRVLW
jgi:hypothetical protein